MSAANGAVTAREPETKNVCALICAGGKGTRAGFNKNKLLKDVLGIPVLERTIGRSRRRAFPRDARQQRKETPERHLRLTGRSSFSSRPACSII